MDNETLNTRMNNIEEKVKIHDQKIDKIENNVTSLLIHNGKLEEVLKQTKEVVDNIAKKLEEYNKKTSFNWGAFVSNTLIPALLLLGIGVFLKIK